MLTISIFSITSCSNNNNSAIIKVIFSGMQDRTFIMEEIYPGRIMFLDSVRTNSKGKFTYKYSFRDSNPVFLRIYSNDNDYLTLLVAPEETVNISSIINLAHNYKVEGSIGSSLVRELNLKALDTYQKIETLSSRYNNTIIKSKKQEIQLKWNELYIEQKRYNIHFLIRNPKSMSSILALYQSFSNGIDVFSEKSDFPFFTMIADSLSAVYPTAPHVRSLIKNVENRTSAIDRLKNLIKIDEAIPNINLPDIYGVDQNLNSIKDKAILLTFWSAADPNSGMLNKEMKDLYKKMEDKEFEIYQVSLDQNKTLWVSSIVEQNIPWISVHDKAGGTNSIAARIYQINSIPSNYLIDKNGVIIAKNIWGSDLTKKVIEITK